MIVSNLMQETGKDPITGEEASVDDLVPVKTNKAVKPRPSPATSIPGLLGLFHNVRNNQHYTGRSLLSNKAAPSVTDCHHALTMHCHHALLRNGML
jgi:hypothetical protein